MVGDRALDKSEQCPGREDGYGGSQRAPPVVDHQDGHEDAGQAQECADRQVDSPADDDECHADGQDPVLGDRSDDADQVVGAEEDVLAVDGWRQQATGHEDGHEADEALEPEQHLQAGDGLARPVESPRHA